MNHSSISEDQALQILKNDLRKLALEKHAAELEHATPEKRAAIMAQIERDIQTELQKELRKRSVRFDLGALLH